jgi:hypothetical protein
VTILTAMQSAAIRLLGRRPDSFFGAPSGRVFELELTDLVNEVAKDILKSHDWQGLMKFAPIEADGTQTDFDLPEDYDRMLVRSDVVEDTGWFWGYQQVTDVNDFTYWADRGFTITPGVWTLYGNQLHFAPAPTIDAQYPYISSYYARDTSSLALKPAFTADTDEFLLPERLLTLGLVWRWRENKKLDWSGDQEAFTKAISEYAAKDKGSRMYRRTGRPWLAGTYAAWPWTLGGV